ncbi:MAG: hypothetical protein RR651_11715, partial [Lysinibacillus sp.]
ELRAIIAVVGVDILAHPGQLDSFELAEDLVREGLDGIELIHPDHTPMDMELVQKLADKYNLITTGGSDYHGGYGAQVQLGHYTISHLQIPAFIK